MHEAAAGLTADRKLVLEAVRQDGCALQHAAAELLTADRELALVAVRQNGHALQFGIAAMGCATFFFWLQRQA